MIREYTVHFNKDLDRDNSKSVTIKVEEVGECPCCHIATSPTYIDGFMIMSKDNDIHTSVFVVLYCPSCKNFYIAKYISPHYVGTSDLKLDFVFPQQSNYKKFSDEIIQLSPEFVSLYNQALEAESNDSTRGIAGLGYRKAIEFLIKDFLIKEKQKDRESTQKLELGNCVEQLKEQSLITLAKASVWIGNDETHYFKKNPQYDIEDLKKFINALVNKIENYFVDKTANSLVHNKK